MSLLAKEIERICSEERISFDEFLAKVKGKSPQKRAQQGDIFGARDK